MPVHDFKHLNLYAWRWSDWAERCILDKISVVSTAVFVYFNYIL